MPTYTSTEAKVVLNDMSNAINQNILSPKELIEARHTHVYFYKKLRKVCTVKIGLFVAIHSNNPSIYRGRLVMCCKLKRSTKGAFRQCTYENCIYVPPITQLKQMGT